ncbi:MAG: hypothetical protein MR936_01680, partial [Eubacterium sp.]|nr:hypothetical protein [Eubacterium sp.]
EVKCIIRKCTLKKYYTERQKIKEHKFLIGIFCAFKLCKGYKNFSLSSLIVTEVIMGRGSIALLILDIGCMQKIMRSVL